MPNELSFKAQIPVIDANVGVGHTNFRPAPVDSPEELLAEMGRHGVARVIGEALHALASVGADAQVEVHGRDRGE